MRRALFLFVLVLATAVPCGRAVAATKHWAGGWTAETVPIHGADVSEEQGDLHPIIAATDGWIYFAYGKHLYRIDGAAGSFRAIRAIEPGCGPAVDDAMRFVCGARGELLRYSIERTEHIKITPPSGCNFIAPGDTAPLKPDMLAPSGGRMWFTLPDADAIGLLERHGVRTTCVQSVATPRRVVPDGEGVWVIGARGDLGYVAGDKLIRHWSTLSANDGRKFPSGLVADGFGHAFVVMGRASIVVQFDRHNGRTSVFKVGKETVGSIARDPRGRMWVPVVSRRGHQQMRYGLVRIDERGIRTYDLPLTSTGYVSVDRRGRIWITDSHTFTIITPPHEA